MDKSVIVSVRLPETELRKLQLLAQVYDRSVGELIRVAVGKYVEELTRTEEFKTKGLELHRRNEQMLNEFLEASGAIANDAKVMRSLQPDAQSSKVGRLSVVEPGRVYELPGAFVNVEIFPASGYSRFGAAASHKAHRASSKQKRFKLNWKQGPHEWIMEGFSLGNSQELVLSSTEGSEPRLLMWKDSTTGSCDRLELKTAADGRTLIDGVSLSKALKRAEAIRDASDETRRRELLPVVHMEGETS